jgi:signal transduction histidine kinase
MRALKPKNLSLRAKVLILLAVPLVFQLVITAILWNLFRTAEIKAENIGRSKDVLVNLGLFSFSFLDATSRLFTSRIDQSSTATLKFFRRDMDICYGKLGSFQRAVADSKRTSKSLPMVEAALKSLDRLETETAPLMQEESIAARWKNINVFRRQLQKLYGELKIALDAVVAEEKLFESEETEATQTISKLIQILLTLLVVVSIGLTLVLGFLFAQSTLKQLAVVEENARRIGIKRDLLPPLRGGNEISFIDSSLHSAYEQLTYNELERQRLMSMLSHDLRSPLLALKGSLALLIEGVHGELPEAAMSRLAQADRVTDKVVGLVDQILNIEKEEREPLNLATITVAQIFDDALPSVQGMAQDCGITLQCVNGELAVRADLKSISRVLTNLLGNALKFSPRGSKIIVAASELPDRIKIDVIDQGQGMDDEDLPFIFEPYFQTSGGRMHKQGTGLGLSICKELVGLNGGAISVSSARGKGTTFSILLSRPSRPAHPAHQFPKAQS